LVEHWDDELAEQMELWKEQQRVVCSDLHSLVLSWACCWAQL
jgi:hypothetical protein